jgi:SAM-dependent methyltransferase
MGDYTNMSGYYDLIMTSGYYDYQKIVDHLLTEQSYRNILEIGCGTGLIIEEIARRAPNISVTGMDLTQAMLNIAQHRLQAHHNINLLCANITEFKLAKQFEMAFSYGGVWYFVIDGDKEPFMVSHIRDDGLNRKGLHSLAGHLSSGGQLLLGVQGPHHDYERPISNGMIYAQKIEPDEHGFLKHYYLRDGQSTVMAQSTHYRTYSFAEAKAMLSEYGFSYKPEQQEHKQFLRFAKS